MVVEITDRTPPRSRDRGQVPSQSWLTPADGYGCWVAESDAIVGHVSLTPVSSPAEPALLEVTGLPARRLGRVGRLFVHPDGRGRGTARALLDTVVAG